MNVVIFTAIYGGKDVLIEPQFTPSDGVKLVCFSDVPVASAAWDVRVVEPSDPDPRRAAKVFKLCPHRFLDCDASIWADGRVVMKQDPTVILDDMSHDIAMFAHPGLTCAYKEEGNCVRLKKDDPATMRAQMQRYRREGFPENVGLVAATFIVRRHTAAVKELNEAWWSEVQMGSVRDQLSFDYCAWKLGILHDVIPGRLWDNRFMRVGRHRR